MKRKDNKHESDEEKAQRELEEGLEPAKKLLRDLDDMKQKDKKRKDKKHDFDEEKAQRELEKGLESAKKLLSDPDKIEEFLQRLEEKVKSIPLVGDKLAYIPIMTSLLRSYVKKEYTYIPLGSIISITSALLYFVSPVDIIPDVIPGIGYIDDAFVIIVCLKLVESDIDEYVKWREENGIVINK